MWVHPRTLYSLWDAKPVKWGSGQDKMLRSLVHLAKTASTRAHLYVFSDTKAGMQGFDRKLQQEVVEELTRGSPYLKHAEEQDQKVDGRIADMRKILEHATPVELSAAQKKADQILLDAEASRITREWCAVVDMDAFFAAVEQRDNPRLVGLPFAVGSKQMVATASYAARRFGVRSAMPGWIAEELVRRQGGQLLLVAPRMDVYKKEARELNEVVAKYGAHTERSLDEVYLNITRNVRKRARDMGCSEATAAAAILREIRGEITRCTKLTASAGCGPNLLLAKIAADVNKPDGQFITPTRTAEVRRYMSQQPVRRLPGVGRVWEKMLGSLGITTVKELIARRGELVLCLPGKSTEGLLRTALGIGTTQPSNTPQRTCGVERTVSPPLGTLAAKLACVEQLATAAFKKANGRVPVGATVTLKFTSFKRCSMAHTPKGEVSVQSIMHFVESKLADRPEDVRLVSVRLRFQ
eukprot:Sspe_Gene.23305::Locus_9037_Transcript_1_1_Confidence_1.000_Length_1888::g.23305::m.23305/K03511/POLK; DNA polymerase kappa